MNTPLRLLIVDDDRRMAKTLKDILQIKGLSVETAYTAFEAIEKIGKEPFDSVLTDIKMPGMNGVDLYKAIHQLKPDLPVVLMSAYATHDLIQEAMVAGAVATLEKPLDINQILSFFSSLNDYRTIAIVDDDPQFRHAIAEILNLRGFVVIEISEPKEILEEMVPEAQIVLLDMKFNGISGLDVLKTIRALRPELPVVIMTGYRKEMSVSIQHALEISAYTCLYKPFQIEELLKVITDIRNQQLSRIFQSK
jgi:two-component system response regulator HydG